MGGGCCGRLRVGEFDHFWFCSCGACVVGHHGIAQVREHLADAGRLVYFLCDETAAKRVSIMHVQIHDGQANLGLCGFELLQEDGEYD